MYKMPTVPAARLEDGRRRSGKRRRRPRPSASLQSRVREAPPYSWKVLRMPFEVWEQIGGDRKGPRVIAVRGTINGVPIISKVYPVASEEWDYTENGIFYYLVGSCVMGLYRQFDKKLPLRPRQRVDVTLEPYPELVLPCIGDKALSIWDGPKRTSKPVARRQKPTRRRTPAQHRRRARSARSA